MARENDRTLLAAPPEQKFVYLWPEHFRESAREEILNETFVLQYWPESLDVSHSPNYSSEEIPGATLPLYNYSGHGERTISFSSALTCEVDNPDADSIDGIPSSRFTVDINAAIARLEAWKLPSFRSNGVRYVPPPRLVLTMPGVNLGRNTDELVVVMKDASFNYESFFPSGKPRVVRVNFQFAESAQKSVGGKSRIEFPDRDDYSTALQRRYNFRGGQGH